MSTSVRRRRRRGVGCAVVSSDLDFICFPRAATLTFLTGEEYGSTKSCSASIMAERCKMLPPRPSAPAGIPLKAAPLQRGKAVEPIPALDPKLLVTSKVRHHHATLLPPPPPPYADAEYSDRLV